MVSSIAVDGQNLKVSLDTGAQETFFISSQSLIDGKPCDELLYGCYQCKPLRCAESDELTFADGRDANVAHYSVALDLGKVKVRNVKVGLIQSFNTSGLQPHSSLGLAPKPKSDKEGFIPLLDQLLEKGVIAKREFSIYFDPDNVREGELILGGEDSMRYHEPLQHVPLTANESSWTVDLKHIWVGEETVQIPSTAYPVIIDSGADGFYGPLEVIRPVLTAIESSLLARDRYIEYDSEPSNLHKLQSCNDRVYLPSLQLAFRGESDAEVLAEVPPELYISESLEGDECHIFIKDVSEEFGIGVNLLRRYYLHFQQDNRKIGIAKAKQKSRKQSAQRKNPTKE